MCKRMMFILCLMYLPNSFALPWHPQQKSLVLPVLLQVLNQGEKGQFPSQKYLKNSMDSKISNILQRSQVSSNYLKNLAQKLNDLATNKSTTSPFYLPVDDLGDDLIKEYLHEQKNGTPKTLEVPKIALHAFRFDVIEEDDDMAGDDIYLYFFVTDGLIPTGKVTNIYRQLHEQQSFFLDHQDRIIYPSLGVPALAPSNHLIIDYGVVESEGRDIEDLKKITSVIVDLALAVYVPAAGAGVDPTLLMNLRKEVKNLADTLISLDADDRLVTHSLYYRAEELGGFFAGESYRELQMRHQGKNHFSLWDYQLNFRFLLDK